MKHRSRIQTQVQAGPVLSPWHFSCFLQSICKMNWATPVLEDTLGRCEWLLTCLLLLPCGSPCLVSWNHIPTKTNLAVSSWQWSGWHQCSIFYLVFTRSTQDFEIVFSSTPVIYNSIPLPSQPLSNSPNKLNGQNQKNCKATNPTKMPFWKIHQPERSIYSLKGENASQCQSLRYLPP